MPQKVLSSPLVLSVAFIVLASILVTKAAAVNEKVIHNFIIYPHGAQPVGNLIADAAGNLYGTTQFGGEHGYGAIFRMARKPNGKWVETVLHSFGGVNDGLWPNGGLTLDTAGNLYGTTRFGGRFSCGDGCGTVFELAPTAGRKWNYSIIYYFKGAAGSSYPNGGVVFDNAGNLYSTANGDLVNGIVFELVRSSTGWREKTVYRFSSLILYNLAIDATGSLYGSTLPSGSIFQLTRRRDGKWLPRTVCDGCAASGVPVFDSAGNLYVDAANQVLELLRKQGWKAIAIAEFTGSEGEGAAGVLTFDNRGNLYGTTLIGGQVGSCGEGYGCGTAFRLTHTKNGMWQHIVLYRFKGKQDGEEPAAGMSFDPSGQLYGITSYGGDPACHVDPGFGGCGTVFELATASDGQWKYSVIERFGGGDGSGPSGLIADGAGNLYGTLARNPGGGCGLVYELTPSLEGGWNEHVLYQFRCGSLDGMIPASGLTLDFNGNLYGTTSQGGGYGLGTVFELTPNSNGTWSESVLYTFTGGADGSSPAGGLIFDAVGNLYGTTELGGNGWCYDNYGEFSGCGVVYELSPKSGGWKETSLHTFAGAPNDGAFPAAALIFDQVGNLYGTTTWGGSGPCEDENDNFGCGTAFLLSPGLAGVWSETVLYNFSASAYLASPDTGLAMDAQGNLYGATDGDGTSTYCPQGCGTVYQLTSGHGGPWTANVLYDFGGFEEDGRFPVGTLVFDNSGNLYGTTLYGGGSSACGYWRCGTVFKLSPSSGGGWTEHVVHGFAGPYHDGAVPMAGVILDVSGTLYGTTTLGGIDQGLYTSGGTVFEITP
jgi:uncharacterized repeat protein (TIGR03803 family)